MNRSQKTYLIAPLDWGLGHATRCVPIVRLLLEYQQKVVLAGSGLSITYLQKEFPHLTTLHLPGMPVSFETGQGFGLKTILLGLRMRQYVATELRLTDKIVREHKIDVIISDNRYGVRCESTRNILITHQIYPRTPLLLKFFAHRMVRHQIGEFDQCWTPDYPNENEPNSDSSSLSGQLSHGENSPENVHFIGPLSRFVPQENFIEKDIDILAIVSGPEPARSDFEKLLRAHLPHLPGKKVLICGREFGIEHSENSVQIIPGVGSVELQNYIGRSKKIICRSGYSSIMDLAVLGRSALLVPTPGQSEQEYLAFHLASNHTFAFIAQSQIEKELANKIREIPEDHDPLPVSNRKIKWLLNLADLDKGNI